uniref:hydroxyacylglutathione hydrolase n=2 Tax=Ascaris TaxID=6251 RepID=A0A0M3HTC7_ASCLU
MRVLLSRRLVYALHRTIATMKVTPVPALTDNYMYLLIDENTRQAAIVDPVDVPAIRSAVQSAGAELSAALVTHHHWDHAGETAGLSNSYGNRLAIYGGDDRISKLTNKVKDGDKFKIGSLEVTCLFTPCHTRGHICYYVVDTSGKKAVFTGDTLFIGGCGRFFEGNATEMHSALNEKLASLPDDTEVYCGHEYTVTNLRFAHSVEPSNEEVSKKLAWSKAKQERHEPTVPSTIGEEKRFNPFMRVAVSEELQKLAKSTDPVAVMAVIREMKNNFS